MKNIFKLGLVIGSLGCLLSTQQAKAAEERPNHERAIPNPLLEKKPCESLADLPDHMKLQIAEKLPIKSLVQLMRTCRHHSDILNDELHIRPDYYLQQHKVTRDQLNKIIQIINKDQLDQSDPKFYTHKFLPNIACSPDGKLFATCSSDGSVQLWSFELQRLLCVLGTHADIVCALAFSPDSSILVSGSCNGCVRLWNVSNQTAVRTIQIEHHQARDGYAIVFSPNGTVLVVPFANGIIQLLSADNGKCLCECQKTADRFPVQLY